MSDFKIVDGEDYVGCETCVAPILSSPTAEGESRWKRKADEEYKRLRLALGFWAARAFWFRVQVWMATNLEPKT
jgi:hypothetical protein